MSRGSGVVTVCIIFVLVVVASLAMKWNHDDGSAQEYGRISEVVTQEQYAAARAWLEDKDRQDEAAIASDVLLMRKLAVLASGWGTETTASIPGRRTIDNTALCLDIGNHCPSEDHAIIAYVTRSGLACHVAARDGGLRCIQLK